MKGTLKERFWAKVDRRGPDDCWEWTAGCVSGYGAIRSSSHANGIRGTMLKAPRVSWELHRGPNPNGLHVCHHCDNPPCVNPAHLFLGTPADNARDRDSKKRRRQPKGGLNGRAKLSELDVKAMRFFYSMGSVSAREVGHMFGVSKTTSHEIMRGEKWSHV